MLYAKRQTQSETYSVFTAITAGSSLLQNTSSVNLAAESPTDSQVVASVLAKSVTHSHIPKRMPKSYNQLIHGWQVSPNPLQTTLAPVEATQTKSAADDSGTKCPADN
jgi:hypothetical protein